MLPGAEQWNGNYTVIGLVCGCRHELSKSWRRVMCTSTFYSHTILTLPPIPVILSLPRFRPSPVGDCLQDGGSKL